ncbi:MAG: class I SAM-dependent methyltransferase [Gemmobacter sp.]
MATSDEERWNNRFSAEHYIFGQAPNEFLQRKAGGLPPGKALCIADGEGRNGVWLAEQGWDVLSLDFSEMGQRKAAALAAQRGVTLSLEHGDVHGWVYPWHRFDLVVDIFTQFSDETERARKWQGLRHSLKIGGHLILVGYTPRQLAYGTGGPKDAKRLYTAELLRQAFAGMEILHFEETETVLDEGPGHRGMSAFIGMLARSKALGRRTGAIKGQSE